MKLLYLAVAIMVTLVALTSAKKQTDWKCTCFKPDYDYGICKQSGGKMEKDFGNVCEIPISNPKNFAKSKKKDIKKFTSECKKIGGSVKCK